ncbi:phage integrase family protein [Mycobacteroides abscessus subsp. massiliense]|uniref:tyrosine-type recombinase/integrase n=1 Tax=Mycobacteroides abscessus TaxID=36809 RepID=UPI0009A74943|nr:site-specific integrase [Mycobacteroides abscessus]SLH95641.1 phage integrase family protein [Mycobacteroides abscessus subsp. massiliense]SLI84616.1 phage integrase family protein [Mycobacteroides abscessus subsp. massiliense]
MAYIRVRETKARAKGRQVRSYVVCWREPVRDEFGAIVPGKTVQRTDTFDTEKAAKARLLEVETGLAGAKGIDPSSAKAKANRPLGEYARQYLDSLVGQMEPTTIEGYDKLYRTHIAPVFGQRPVAGITAADVDRFRASLFAPHQRRSFVTRGKAKAASAGTQPNTTPGTGLVARSPKTVKHIVGTLKRILDVAVRDGAVASNPVLPGPRRTTKRRTRQAGATPFVHHPLSANQVAAVVDWIAREKGNQVYALAVLFAAHTGVRAAELQGLQVQDVTLSDIPGTVGSIRVARTMKRSRPEGADDTARLQWAEGTPKSDASTNRVVPLAPWLADEMRDYLTTVHPFAGKKRIAHAPLFPGRRSRSSFDWAKPVVADNLYDNYLQPACKALGLGSVRFHDLRHTFATMNLSAGEHYMQVSKWLGHSSFVLTLTTYADYIREDELAAPKVGRGIAEPANIVPLARKSSAAG